MSDGTKIAIGTTESGSLDVDIDRLIGAHMGIVGNSGSGKSGLIRKLLEATHGKIQHIVLDSEDEFYTLREKFNYVIAGGEDGDTAATNANAKSLALTALEHGISMICQINDLGREGAREFISTFIDALITAPRDLWHPCLIVVDEAHRFDSASIGRLTAEGRKRGFTAVIATQRLPKMDPDVRGDLNNWIMGRVGQSLDKKHMADQMGMTSTEAKEALKLKKRQFWAMGPALSFDPVLFTVGEVETTIIESGQARISTPPAPDDLRDILAALAVPAPIPEPEPTLDPMATAMRSPGEIADLRAAVARKDGEIAKLKALNARLAEETEKYEAFCLKLRGILVNEWPMGPVADALSTDRIKGMELGGRPVGRKMAIEKTIGVDIERHSDLENDLICVPMEPTEDPQLREEMDDVQKIERAMIDALTNGVLKRQPAAVAKKNSGAAGETTLNTSAFKMIDMLDRIAPAKVTWASLAAMIGNKPRGGNFNAARKGMRESGRIIENGNLICSASAGREGMSRDEAIALWKEVLTARAPDMIEVLFTYPSLTKQELADKLGVAAKGGHWNNSLSQLTRNGVVTDNGGLLNLADPLPGQKPE